MDIDDFKPMLSGSLGNLDELDFESNTIFGKEVSEDDLAGLEFQPDPNYLVSQKIDGIRCVTHHELGAVSRTLKAIPNNYIREKLSNPAFAGLDGEIIVGSTFNETQSAVMSIEGEPEFTFNVFDYYLRPWLPFGRRYEEVCNRVDLLDEDFLRVVSHRGVTTSDMLDEWLYREGWEGLMFRKVDAPYKFGRSTAKEQGMLKYKPIEDAEARFTGCTQLEDKNGDKQELVGSLIVEGVNGAYEGKTFNIGTGLSRDQREDFWFNTENYLGKTITYRYQKDTDEYESQLPRFPVFKCFRQD